MSCDSCPSCDTPSDAGTRFTCFTGTKVQILTQKHCGEVCCDSCPRLRETLSDTRLKTHITTVTLLVIEYASESLHRSKRCLSTLLVITISSTRDAAARHRSKRRVSTLARRNCAPSHQEKCINAARKALSKHC